MNVSKIFVFIYLLSISPLINAQQIVSAGHEVNFTSYTVEDGLVGGNIYMITQDSKGYLYISTSEGLSIFDGTTFKNYTQQNGLNGKDVFGAVEDDHHNIWIASTGIQILQNGKLISFDSTTMLPQKFVTSIFKDKDGTIWAGSRTGVCHLDPKNIKKPFIKNYPLLKDGNSARVRTIGRKNDGVLYIGCDGAYFEFEADSFSLKRSVTVYALIEFGNGKDWICGWESGAQEYVNGVHKNTYSMGSGVIGMAKDRKGNVWLASWDRGIFKYDGKKFINYTTKEGLVSNTFWTTFEDREGNMWFGCWGNGLVKYSGEKFTFLTEKYGILNSISQGALKDQKGRIWFWSENGISCYDKEQNKITNYDSYKGSPMRMVMSASIDKNNVIWIPGYARSHYKIIDDKLSEFDRHGGFIIYPDTNGDLWFGSDGNGALRYRGDSRTDFVAGKSWDLNRVLGIYKDSKGNFWFTNTMSGITFCNIDTTVFLGKKSGFLSTRATSICEDGKGYYWITCYNRGVFKCTIDNKFQVTIHDSITVKNGLHSNPSCHFMDERNLYIGTLQGLCVVDRRSLDKRIKNVRCYNKEDGFVNVESFPSTLDNDGHLWISTLKGIYCFDPNDTAMNRQESKTHITNLKLFFDTLNWDPYCKGYDYAGLPNELNLPYDKNHLTFGFTGICFSAPQKVLFQYKLEGLDKNWSPVSHQREAVYSNIPPGTYTFMVKSCNNDGLWNKEPTCYVFTITPPFWRTAWFYVLCAVIFSGGIYFVIKRRERKLREEKLKLEEQVNDRTRELKTALGEIEEKNKDITDSINYAKKIQDAILPAWETKEDIFRDTFILFMPRDIVSGDFYWFTSKNGKRIITAADCTGHGVPGALMSMIGNSFLNEVVEQRGITEPAKILGELRDLVIRSLKQTHETTESKDGMDMALLAFDDKNRIVEFAGANNPLWLIRDGELLEFDPDKSPIGYHRGTGSPFNNHKIELKKNDVFYIFTDGFADQFGGEKGKKFKYKQFKEFLISINDLDIHKQKEALRKKFEEWKGMLAQVDDILVIGIKI